MDALFADDANMEPYWWEAAPRPALPEAEVPAAVDVAVVGAGFTGLSAALTLARAGRSVALFDAEHAGWGCSTRAGGQIGTKLRRSFAALRDDYGRERAIDLVGETTRARDFVFTLVRDEQIECSLTMCGRFVGAHRAGDYESQARDAELLRAETGAEIDMVPRAEQRRELGTDGYFGGQLIHHNASLHPALFHQGLLDRVLSAGVRVAAHTPVRAIERDKGGFTVASTRTRARAMIVVTNGYTDAAAPAFRRRVIPIGSYIIATEPIERALMDRLMPKRRVLSDTRRIVYYYRPSPDGTRILFGGRVAATETDPARSGPRLHAVMAGLFPELAEVRISHSWVGFVGYTFDSLPHIGVRDGVHYAMGYCGSGVSMAPYLGHKAALRVLGRADEARTAFDGLGFETRPFYTGVPWFLSGAVLYYSLLDRMPSGRGPRA